MDEKYEARHFLVSGRVQGVCYRMSAQQQAQRLGLRGWVRNLPDGRVEAQAYGIATILDQFQKWLWQGPELARVDAVQVRIEAKSPQHESSERFEIL